MQQQDTTPWYRQFWPWLILAILGWGVISSSITLSVALKNPPHMMTGDYERLGKALVDTHVRADRAEALGLAGTLRAAQGEWLLQLTSSADARPGEKLLLLIQHPTDSARDRQVVLNRSAEGRYRAAAAQVPARGRLIVSDLGQTWWISASYRREGDGLEAALKPERL
ncbi:MAG: FixH family protein [Wenzhouxiangellaceae bacterium]|nr:FixH family protein [Wenzhouxiangellaceae bacterium]MBS3745630.1 FixH family protein [Wenzhouxiangellaceae bacterium]MBS3822470.1 FixH family protein [Wenzhouxiangellaceae bacterium]